MLCDRGAIARVLKCAHVAEGGAAGCVLANAAAGQTRRSPIRTSFRPSTSTWTISTTSPAGMTLTADPSAFVLSPGLTQDVEFTATPSALPLDIFAFAEVLLTEPSGTPDLHFPVAVRPALDNFPERVEITTFNDNGSQLVTGLRAAVAITDLDVQASGLALGTVSDVSLVQDPTNGDPYDDLSQVFVRTVGDPFDLSIFWNEPSMMDGQVWFGALDIGTDSGSPGNIGTIGVDLSFFEGEIFVDGFESGDVSAWSGSVP